MMKLSICVTCILSACVLSAMAGHAGAQSIYPTKTIRLVIPFPPGGTSDPLARLVSQKLTEKWGQPVIVENRPGGNTIIGIDAVAKAQPDGYTLLLAGSTLVIVPLLTHTPYDAIKDLAPVATLGVSPQLLVLNPSVPAGTVHELIALAKAKPGQLNYASYGSGSPSHLGAELFSIMAGVKMQHIPYKGAGPAITELIGGQVQLYFSPPTPVIPHVKGGKLKAVAVTAELRLPALPQVPTFVEAGLPGIDVRTWQGVLAPAGTPRAIVDKLSAEIGAIVTMPDTREKLSSQGTDPLVSTPEQFAALMKADIAKYGKVIKTANIKIEN